jgi:very-short-patch-repair endonuclease
MPPTNFFDRSVSADDDDGDIESDQESILEECLGARLPRRRLTWHYRSRNESLIAFSNHRYYDGDLITFPAPVTNDRAVKLRPVNGAWSRGKSRTNQAEAEAIVAEVVARLSDPSFVDDEGKRLTIGVITLNSEQQKLIEDLLDRARRGRQDLEPYFAEDAAEPVVVKNLETVQGDERDVILLGIGYGPETPGAPVMAMNFGPLNRSGGWRRLNVAVTRARREMTVFTSFPSDLIDLNRTSAEAVRDLKHFLEFAERGDRALGEAIAGSVGGFDSPFEQAVARRLRERGWTVVPQIGVSRFRIDLGVVNPDRPGSFLLGVECDGAAYHSAATARDRDKVREAILRQLGWRLERVWSTDWWVDPQGAVDRLDAAIRLALEEWRAEAAAKAVASDQSPRPTDASVGEAHVDPEEDGFDSAGIVELGGSYSRATFEGMSGSLDPVRFQEPSYTFTLSEMIGMVIAHEAPIRDEALIERVARAHGFKRSGRQIRDRVLTLVHSTAHVEIEKDGAAFIWPSSDAAAAWQLARYPATSADTRPIEDISLQELAAALKSCTSDDPDAEAARAFGFRRVTTSARERMKKARLTSGHFLVR